MDFIERLLGVSPDHGDGSLEIVWLAAIALAVLAVVCRRRIASWWSSRMQTPRD